MKLIFKFSVLLLLVLTGCKRDKVDSIGPGYVSVPANFEAISFTASTTTVDFTTDSVLFNGTLSDNVTWKITITGQTSGAVREISGTSSSFSNVVWNGNHSAVYFFRPGETAVATLSFYGTDITLSIPITISKARNFSTYGKLLPWGDFENPAKINDANNWHGFNNPPIPNESQGVDSMAIDYNGNLVSSVQGKYYYYIKGLGNQPAFVSGISFDKGPGKGMFTTPLPATPDDIWVNIYIYGTGDANAQVDVEYKESDAGGKKNGYQDTDDDSFVQHITLKHKGWQLFSFKYNQMVPSTNIGIGDRGNKLYEPEKLMIFDIVLLKKSNPDSPVELYFDFPFITVGHPFNPSK